MILLRIIIVAISDTCPQNGATLPLLNEAHLQEHADFIVLKPRGCYVYSAKKMLTLHCYGSNYQLQTLPFFFPRSRMFTGRHLIFCYSF